MMIIIYILSPKLLVFCNIIKQEEQIFRILSNTKTSLSNSFVSFFIPQRFAIKILT